jgi:hypothetical protein
MGDRTPVLRREGKRYVTRAERVAAARRMRAEGATLRVIGEALGATESAAWRWLRDPTGEIHRARLASYTRTCVDCGGPCTYRGVGRAVRCQTCAPIAARRWARETVVAAMWEWAQLNGRPPDARSWMKATPDTPTTTTVCRVFADSGAWNGAMVAAGFEPRPAHAPPGVGAASINAAKTHCKHGHEFTEENTYRPPIEGRHHRHCRTCVAAAVVRYRRRQQMAA